MFSLDRLIGDTSKIPTLIDHCLISNREGLGTSRVMGSWYESVNYGISNYSDPPSHKVQIKLYKIPQFGVNRPNSKQDTAI